MGLNQAVKSLVREIVSTREFRELKQSVNNLKQYKDLEEQFNSLEERRMALFQSKRPVKELDQQAREIEREFELLSKNPEVAKMYKANNNFNKLIGEVYQEINTLLESEF